MAKIPIISVPEAPKGDASLAPAPMLDMPQVRYQGAVNYEKHIGGLMQPELSGRPFQARAAAQAGIGRALQNVGGDLIQTSLEINSLIGDMQRAKDKADYSYASVNRETLKTEFEERVAKENLGGAERMKLWQEEYEPKMTAYLETRKVSPGVREDIDLEQKNFNARMRTGIWHQVNKEQIDEHKGVMLSDYQQRMTSGDHDGAGGVVVKMVEAKVISKEEGHQMIADISRSRLEQDLLRSGNENPRAALAEMIESETLPRGSDVYGKLNVELSTKWKRYFQGRITDEEEAARKELVQHKEAGMLTDPDDVVRVAKGRLTDLEVHAWQEEQKLDPVYDEGKIVTMHTKVMGYRADKDDEARTLYSQLYFEIGRTVPKHLQGLMRSELHNEATRVREGKETPREKQLIGESAKFLTDAGDLGYYDPPEGVDPITGTPTGYDSKKLAGMKPEEREQYNREHWTGYGDKWKRINEAQDEIAKLIKNKSDITRTEILKEINALVDPEKRDKLQKESNYRAFQMQSARDLGIIPRRAGSGGAGASVPASAKEVRENLKSSTTPGYGMKTSMRATREEIMSELDKDPKTKMLAMQMLDTEGGGVATMEALVNRTAMIREKVPGWTLWDELNSGFYGPIKRGHAQARRLDAGRISRYEQDIQAVRAGSNVIQGRTDQGYAGDPNASGPGRVFVKSNPKEVYNYWTGKRGSAQFSHADAAAFARRMMRVETET